MKELYQELKQNIAVQSLINKKSELGNLSLIEEALLIATAYKENNQSLFIIKNNTYTAQRLYERLQPFFEHDVLLYSVEESLRVESIAASPEIKASQMEVIARILTGKPFICIMNSAAAIRFMPKKEVFQDHCITLKNGLEIGYEHLKQLLYEAGYQHVSRVDQPLCYAARGGIIDVYSMNHDDPLRIEFFDDEIDSIRYFDIHTQRTKQVIDEVLLIPATPLLFQKEEVEELQVRLGNELKKQEQNEGLETRIQEDLDALANNQIEPRLYKYRAYLESNATIFDYCEQADIMISSKEEVQEAIKHIQEETIAFIQEQVEEHLSLPKYSLFHDLSSACATHSLIEVGMFVDYKKGIQSQILEQTSFDGNVEAAIEQILEEAKTKKVVLCLGEKEKQKIKNIFQEHGILYTNQQEELHTGIQFYEKEIYEGFQCVNEKISVYTAKEIFAKKPRVTRYANKFKEAEVLHSYMELNVGDYVVHNQHGVGKYLGIVTRENDGVHKDYLQIAYKGEDVLFVPIEHFTLIRKFMSKEGATPKLHKLGSGEWEKTKRKVNEKVEELAQRLVQLYALREEHIGYAFSKDSVFQQEFEDDFPYELTEDQKQAVKEIKEDMESSKPMDRLLCGDVGFGKTEVAARAAFKAVIDKKQVAFLCPTTILSLQHYKTFVKRFANFPVRIEVINRFILPKKQKEIIQDAKEGKIDILIGTHRILSKDIKFSDLGLLCIDEEQRFGVEHKERIKEYKNNVDVLSLSATPIPRTLQMSLVGIRSLSQLNTPPQNRLPVQTYVIEKNFTIIKDIIQREIARNGQVFYLHNNVSDIFTVAKKLTKLLPDVQIGVAHGKMSREEIEDVMLQFTNNEYQVLVCTTIIETGIDIPNANTMIIDQADRFGLSQLYQIKGRVGRSDRLAYAYLMYTPEKQLSEIAQKRLKSIKEFTQLGSGYKIAMRDLSIRGAGDMLGPQQAGFIDTVGMDMYLEMLHDAIVKEKGLKVEQKESIPKQNIKVDAYIPNTFATEDFEKITLYQEIEQITDKEALLAKMEETTDNYGKLPKAVQLLFEKKRLEILTHEDHVAQFKELNKTIEITYDSYWSNHIDGVKLFEIINAISRDISIRYVDQKITIKFPKRKDWIQMVFMIMERVSKMELKSE